MTRSSPRIAQGRGVVERRMDLAGVMRPVLEREPGSRGRPLNPGAVQLACALALDWAPERVSATVVGIDAASTERELAG